MQNKYNHYFNFFLFSGLACFSYFFMVLYSDISPQHQNLLISFWAFLLVVFVFNALGFSIMLINEWQKRSYQFLVRGKHQLLINCILMAGLLFLLNYLLFSIVKVLLEIPSPFALRGAGVRMIFVVWLVEMVIVSLTMVANFYRQLIVLHEKANKLEESAIKAQYVALQNQVNPHFLFNNLNTLISEIEYNPENAVVFTRRLSDVYRYILQSQQEGLVTLRSEITFLKSFIFLHQVRLGDCLFVDNRIDPALLEKKIPSFTLQLLTENVIKHNIINSDKPMTIHLSTTEDGKMLVVSNQIRLKQNVVKSGTGLRNLSSRYKLMSNQDIIVENDSNCFTVKIPLLNE
ncbi:histidine kinase [Parabacteroides sp. TM07-1AC]|uniref:sensor histidine kinase n=1 Tax=Parabacteroides sp. TM07-1AC TaxID=2292363 RepID=UPI000F004847|nr:histidine kinase [Parabacteroides sp. TM07-1AC]RHU24201.1 histidine kinase [Parabacteroides sp. TM07-1AC]